MSHLWDNDELDEIVDTTIQPLPRQELVELAPDQLVSFERSQQQSMIHQTVQFAEQLISCEQIVVAAHKVADYTPPFQNDLQSEFWTQKVIPILVKSLEQDALARATITKSFGSIRDLAITIESVYQIVKQSKGSKMAVEIAQKNIPHALAKLDKYIEIAESLDSNAINEFSEQLEEIFKIIGPEAAKFVKQKAGLEARINKYYKKQEKLYSELGDKQGEVNSTAYLIEATEKYLSGAERDLGAAKQRLYELNQMNMDVERTIKNIPQTTERTITTWFLKNVFRVNKTVTENNPNRESDKTYFDSIIATRMDRIKNNLSDEKDRAQTVKAINDDLANYKANYQKAVNELKVLQESLESKLSAIQEEIDKLRAEIEELDKIELETVAKIGLQGNTLINCLVHVRSFAKSLQHKASAYAPLVAILNGIKAMVKAKVDLLSSDRDEDIFLAGNLLIKQVAFMSAYALDAQKIMQPSIEYDMDELARKMKRNAITNE